MENKGMDIGRSFGYMFHDKDWLVRILIGGLLSIVPILNFVVYGYMLQVLRNVAGGQELPLPTWDGFGEKFMKGLMLAIASFIYSLPLIILGVIVSIVMAIAGGAASGSSRDSAGAAGGIAGICMLVYYCVIFLYAIIVYGFVMWPGVMRYAETGEFGVFFKFGENFGVAMSNLGGYIVMLLVIWLAGIVASLVGLIACGVGVFFTSFWVILVSGHLFGQYWAQFKLRQAA